MTSHRAFVELELDGRPPVVLGPGDLIGRLAGASLRLDDPRISEAHAMVSNRDGALVILRLRGQLALNGRLVDSIALEPETRFELVAGLEARVREVYLPRFALALALDDGAPEVLVAREYSVVDAASLRLLPGVHEGALALLWCTSGRWTIQVQGQPAEALAAGTALQLAGRRIACREVPPAPIAGTELRGRLASPLRVQLEADRVQVHDAHGAAVILTGMLARILIELKDRGGRAPRDDVAQAIWGPPRGRRDYKWLQDRWYQSVRRLRLALEGAGMRTSLIRTDRAGDYELFLLPDDRLEDRRQAPLPSPTRAASPPASGRSRPETPG